MISLDKNQQKAVETLEGPVLLLAGAGAGKTRVLTQRVAHMLEQGIPGSQILAVTFTNKAANEMARRIQAYPQAQEVTIKTIHGLAARIILRNRPSMTQLGFPPELLILDPEDVRGLLASFYQNLTGKCLDAKGLRELSKQMEAYVNGLIQATTWLKETFKGFMDYKRERGVLSFDDLLLYANRLLDFKEVLGPLQARYRYFSVDEYQDTNPHQARLLLTLSAHTQSICVVGDADQSIYGFRGADLRNIFDFEQHFKALGVPVTKIFLETNYRSGSQVVALANQAISFNANRKGAPMLDRQGQEPKKAPIQIRSFSTAQEEARSLARQVREALDQGAEPEEIAVLYRYNAQSYVLQGEFRNLDIPFRVLGGQNLGQRKVIKDLVSFAQFLAAPRQNFVLRQIINTPRIRFGEKTLDKWEDQAQGQGISLWDYLLGHKDQVLGKKGKKRERMDQLQALLTAYQQGTQAWTQWTWDPRSQGLGLIDPLVPQSLLGRTLAAYIDQIYQGEVQAHMEKQLEAGIKAGRDLDQVQLINLLLNIAEGAGNSLDHFLERILLDGDQEGEEGEPLPQVTLSTIHSAKGLEWDWVFVIQVNQGLFPRVPRQHGKNDLAKLEEERRCFYVALTRAKVDLGLSYILWDPSVKGQLQPSTFLKDILKKQDGYRQGDDLIVLNKPELLEKETTHDLI